MNCNATLTTLTPTDEVVAHMPRKGIGTTPLYDTLIPDNQTVTRRGDRLLRADVTEVTCNDHIHDALTAEPAHRCLEPWAEWTDDTPGATPHRDPDIHSEKCCGVIPELEDTDPYPCPDCDGRGWRLARDGWSYGDCPSCGGRGTRPTVPDADLNELSDRIENLEQGIWRLHGLPNVREEPGGQHVNAIRYCGECKRRWPCPTVKLNTEAWQAAAAARARQENR